VKKGDGDDFMRFSCNIIPPTFDEAEIKRVCPDMPGFTIPFGFNN